MSVEDELSIRRILVALDAATEMADALETCALLAARLDAELHGLFIEDVNLLRLAQFPSAQQFSSFSTSGRPLDVSSIEAELRALATRARRALAATAERNSLLWSFSVVRGPIAGALTTAAADVDLLVVPSATRAVTRHAQLLPRALTLTKQVPRTVLVLRRGLALAKTAVVVYDGSRSAQHALLMSRRLFGGQAQLLVLLATAAAEHTADLRRHAERTLGTASGTGACRFQWLHEPGELGALMAPIDAAVLVLPAASEWLQRPGALEMLEAGSYPILLVRD
ncbi:MAG: hypothetical protein U1E76_01755 [Planctomycetota bacterium]